MLTFSQKIVLGNIRMGRESGASDDDLKVLCDRGLIRMELGSWVVVSNPVPVEVK